MRIAIDSSPIQNDHKLRGIGSYTAQLIEALKTYGSQYSYHLFTRGQIVPKNVDIVHYPYFDPFLLTLPLKKVKPTVVTVHDLIPIANSGHFPRGIRGSIKWQMQRFSLQNTQRIITDSLASKKDIHEFAGIPNERITVVYLAVSDKFRRIVDRKTLTSVSKRLSLPERYILYVGDVNWNKNIKGLLRSFDLVRYKIDNIKLVLVGKQFLNSELQETQSINTLISDLNLDKNVLKLGFVKNEDLVSVYSLASVYVQTSFAEGFGFPVLEAMSCGCPVITSNRSSLTEIAGPSMLVDPHNIQDIASEIVHVLMMNTQEHHTLVQEGFRWVKQYSWKKVVRETIAVYEKILE